MLVSSPVAMRSSTSTVGALLPRSTADSMLRLTPAFAASSFSDRRRRARSLRTRAPSASRSSPDDSTIEEYCTLKNLGRAAGAVRGDGGGGQRHEGERSEERLAGGRRHGG